jgi:tRNA-splicing ligase RtcB
MSSESYVVTGKGNAMALHSSPHGAGRMYGRREAKRKFTHDQLVERMTGIEWSGSDAFLDEIQDAYKDISQVMIDSIDLVKIEYQLHQLINVKGD